MRMMLNLDISLNPPQNLHPTVKPGSHLPLIQLTPFLAADRCGLRDSESTRRNRPPSFKTSGGARLSTLLWCCRRMNDVLLCQDHGLERDCTKWRGMLLCDYLGSITAGKVLGKPESIATQALMQSQGTSR